MTCDYDSVQSRSHKTYSKIEEAINHDIFKRILSQVQSKSRVFLEEGGLRDLYSTLESERKIINDYVVSCLVVYLQIT